MKSLKTSLDVLTLYSYISYLLCGFYIIAFTTIIWALFDMLIFVSAFGIILGPLYAIGGILFAVVEVIRRVRYTRKPVFILIGNIICLLFIIGFSYFALPWYIHLNFELHYNQRMQVVRLYQAGKLDAIPDRPDTFSLPPGDQYLSSSGTISLEDDYIIFDVYNGLVDNYTAFVYSPSQATLRGHWQIDCKIEELDASWNYVTCN